VLLLLLLPLLHWQVPCSKQLTWCKAGLENALHVVDRQRVRVSSQKAKTPISTLGIE
jgi:hypothetical protein